MLDSFAPKRCLCYDNRPALHYLWQFFGDQEPRVEPDWIN